MSDTLTYTAINFDPFNGPEVESLIPVPKYSDINGNRIPGSFTQSTKQLVIVHEIDLSAIKPELVKTLIEEVFRNYPALRSMLSSNRQHLVVYKDVDVLVQSIFDHNQFDSKKDIVDYCLQLPAMHTNDDSESPLFKLCIVGSGESKTWMILVINRLLEPLIDLAQLTNDINIALERVIQSGRTTTANNAEENMQANNTFPALFANAVNIYNDKIGLRYGDSSYSYSEINQKSEMVARYLTSLGVHKGDLLGISVSRKAEMLFVLIGAMKIGAVYVPIDPLLPAHRRQAMIQSSGLKYLIVDGKGQSEHDDNVSSIQISKIFTNNLHVIPKEPAEIISENDLAYVLFTSGSTGIPKGVKISHGNLSNLLLSLLEQPGISDSDRLLATTTISFDIAGVELYLPLIAGAEVVLADDSLGKDGVRLLDVLISKHITIFQATPATWKMLIETGWEQKLPLTAMTGGEALPLHLARQMLSRCSEVWNLYGPTETTIYSTFKRISEKDELITIGKPIRNTSVFILNESLDVVAAGETGEIYISGSGLSSGYINNKELTSKRFFQVRALKNETVYQTGDLGKFLPNGEVLCLGRTDSQVKIRGYRVELGEIEFQLHKRSEIRDVAVMIVGEEIENKRITAFVTLNQQVKEKQFVQELRNILKLDLPEYMLPQIVVIKKMPVTVNGKIDKQSLILHSTQPTSSEEKLPATINKTESFLLNLWMDKLGQSAISIHDDFFELGGHSLIAIQIVLEIKKSTGKTIPFSSFYDHSTVFKLARIVDGDQKPVTQRWKSLVPIKPSGSKPPVYIIHGGGSHVMRLKTVSMYMSKEQPVFGFQAIGTNSIDVPVENMEDIAQVYISEMLEQNPDGPYAIAGYSFGGLIAFEMARQLDAMGKKVMMVGLFDSFADQSDFQKPFIRRAWNRLSFVLANLVFQIGVAITDPKFVIDYCLRAKFPRYKNSVARLMKSREIVRQEYEALEKSTQEKITQANKIAHQNYTLVPYQGIVDLFRCDKKLYYLKDFEYYGWKPLALQGVNIHDIPGDHMNIFDPPNDKEFAAILQNVLDSKAQRTEYPTDNQIPFMRSLTKQSSG